MPLPFIDDRVKHVGSTYLRQLNSTQLKAFEGLLVVHAGDGEPLVVVIPYAQFLVMQERCGKGEA